MLFSYPPQSEMAVPEDLEAAIAASAERLAPGISDAVSEPTAGTTRRRSTSST